MAESRRKPAVGRAATSLHADYVTPELRANYAQLRRSCTSGSGGPARGATDGRGGARQSRRQRIKNAAEARLP